MTSQGHQSLQLPYMATDVLNVSLSRNKFYCSCWVTGVNNASLYWVTVSNIMIYHEMSQKSSLGNGEY